MTKPEISMTLDPEAIGNTSALLLEAACVLMGTQSSPERAAETLVTVALAAGALATYLMEASEATVTAEVEEVFDAAVLKAARELPERSTIKPRMAMVRLQRQVELLRASDGVPH